MEEQVLRLQGHTGDVNCSCWSRDAGTLVSCGGDRSVRLWNTSTGAQLPGSPLKPPHTYYVNVCTLSPAGDVLATASSDSSIKLWNTASWTLIGTLTGHSGGVRACDFSNDASFLVSGSADESVRVWDLASRKCVSSITKNEYNVTACVFTPPGWLVVTGGSNGDMMFFDVFAGRASFKALWRALAHDLGVSSLKVSPSSSCERCVVGSAGSDCVVRLWGVQLSASKYVNTELLGTFSQHSAPIYSLCFSPDGSLLATGSGDKTVVLWKVEQDSRKKEFLSVEKQFKAHDRYVTHCSFSPDGCKLASASNDRTIKIWRLRPGHLPDEGEGVGVGVAAGGGVETAGAEEENGVSLISAEDWSVENVCQWLKAVCEAQRSKAKVHKADLLAVEQLADSISPVSPGGSLAGDLTCPITQELFRDPVLAADGFTYERSAISAWFSKGQRTSPVTNVALANTSLLPNRALLKLIHKHRSPDTQ